MALLKFSRIAIIAAGAAMAFATSAIPVTAQTPDRRTCRGSDC